VADLITDLGQKKDHFPHPAVTYYTAKLKVQFHDSAGRNPAYPCPIYTTAEIRVGSPTEQVS